MELRIEGGKPLIGNFEVPPDKSITHRALMLASLCEGQSVIEAKGIGEDNQSTKKVLTDLGVAIQEDNGSIIVTSQGAKHFITPNQPLDCGNSGTTMRLLSGILAGAGINAELCGDASLSGRPMGRVCEPLRKLGANIRGTITNGRELPPLRIDATKAFKGGAIEVNVASAQVKSAIILAGVTSGRSVSVRQPAVSRNHTETMLKALGAPIRSYQETLGSVVVELGDGTKLLPTHFKIPGDFSSAAFFLAAGVLVADSRITITNVGMNVTRNAFLDVMLGVGARIDVADLNEHNGESVATLRVQPSFLCTPNSESESYIVGGGKIPLLIDELVILAALASQVRGTTKVQDAHELRVKESDRISETLRLLSSFGVQAIEQPDGFIIKGPQQLKAARVDVSSDHRIALTAAVLALAAPGESILSGFEVAAVSYPGFIDVLQKLGAKVRVA
ncbi:MAG: 3-phosphoshikimate 1-carboxyvinyltransferase [Deltaproteobacteria bacterium]|nr:3-phosphoshikimate 1-carboxyvinyltransferase [Deltaproteobacteria bacterium]